jgi:hypothetical protein
MKLINPLLDNNAYLYHYTKSDTALNFILKNNTIKLNTFSDVNDPRESKAWNISPFFNVEAKMEHDEHERIANEVSSYLKENAKLICFSKDNSEAKGELHSNAIFDRGFSKPSMWNHYGDAYNGVCLMFNKQKLINIFNEQLEEKKLFHGPVTYTNDGILPNFNGDPFVIDLLLVSNSESYLSAIHKHFNIWYKQLYLQKLLDWSNEDEYRWVYLDDNQDPLYLKYGDALEAIAVGDTVDNEKYQEFRKHCKDHSADIGQITWRNGFPTIINPATPRPNGTGWHA